MSVETVWQDFTGFLTKHSAELESVASALGTIAAALPIDPADKLIVTDAAAALNSAANSIQNWLANASAPQAEQVTIKESDIENAVRDVEAAKGDVEAATHVAVGS